MFTPSTLLAAIQGATPLVGWRQETDPAMPQLDAALVSTVSGRYFQSGHPTLTLGNLKKHAPAFAGFTYTPWLTGTAYVIGDICADGALNYIAIQANTANQPSLDTDFSHWVVYTEGMAFSTWLTTKTDEAILAVFDDIFEQLSIDRTGKTLLEERPLFDGTAKSSETVPNQSKVAGFEVNVVRSMGVVTRIHQIGIMFADAGTFDVKLYHSSVAAALQTESVTVDAANTVKWITVDWDLAYFGADAGGTYTVEYEQSTAPLAINKAIDFGDPIYQDGLYHSAQMLWSQYVQFHPFTVAVADRADPTKRVKNYGNNYGLNMIVSSRCDFTGLLVRQKSNFTNVLIKGVAAKLLREIVLNPNARINHNAANADVTDLLYEIDGNPEGRKSGLGLHYEQALKSVKVSLEEMDRECLKCKKRGLKFGVA